jgi:glycosyltransferase involved in cell wall biosynthesis
MKSSNKGVAMFSLFFEPLSMGGSEMQAKRLSKELMKKHTNVLIVTMGNKNLPRQETIDCLKIFRFIPFIHRIKVKEKKYEQRDVIFDYSKYSGDDLLYSRSNRGLKQIISMTDIFISSFFLFLRLRNQFSIIQINTVSNVAIIGVLIGLILRKKVVIKDSTMDGLLQMRNTPFPFVSRILTIKYTSIFVAMTDVIAANYRKAGVPDCKIEIIPNGIEVQQSLPDPSRLGTGKCLFVGNLYQQPAKGIDILLKAWPKVLNILPMASLTIVGDGAIDKYRDYIMNLGLEQSISFVGKKDSRNYYLTHDLFILPSRREGMSNALMEAMLYSLPVVATSISGNIDLIDVDGGRLVPPNDSEALSEAIIEMLRKPDCLSMMGRHNRDTIVKKCSITAVAHAYQECYSLIL